MGGIGGVKPSALRGQPNTEDAGGTGLGCCVGLTFTAESGGWISLRPPAARLVSRGGAARGRAVMAGRAVRERAWTLPGRAERARVARAFVGEILGPGTRAEMHPPSPGSPSPPCRGKTRSR